ncbi:hypothetical protein [Novipirellula artificiosorum]|uniref:Uncharacterized protein n=1 Tax=Novipirellula artificiosorum TaxID=2528016 RepID=A0A5C6D7V0_9BACT|nr:hypothetical protein [Novipirellula artificiosorum]TWU31781.1 hypothetical protein Poly41_60160 [Novipirellula artificiosorum]
MQILPFQGFRRLRRSSPSLLGVAVAIMLSASSPAQDPARSAVQNDSLSDLIRHHLVSESSETSPHPSPDRNTFEGNEQAEFGVIAEGLTDQLLDREQAQVGEAAEAGRAELRGQQLAALRKPITDIGVEGSTKAVVVPVNQARQLESGSEVWIASLGLPVAMPDRYSAAFCHEPLYFEQLNLERCGRHYGFFQNAVSMAQFVGRTGLWPYHLAATPMHQCVASPGDCLACESFPTHVNPFPVDSHGALLEAAAIAGFIILLQ